VTLWTAFVRISATLQSQQQNHSHSQDDDSVHGPKHGTYGVMSDGTLRARKAFIASITCDDARYPGHAIRYGSSAGHPITTVRHRSHLTHALAQQIQSICLGPGLALLQAYIDVASQ